jgi:Mrp family chromosome partitioning ATPase
MREEVMSGAVLFPRTSARAEARRPQRNAPAAEGWDPEDFALEQIRGLVRRVFFSNVERPVRQVVFSALDADTDVKSICRSVGEALAVETVSNVAVVGEYPQVLPDGEMYQTEMSARGAGSESTTLRRAANRLRRNLWLVPHVERDGDTGATALLHSHLGAMRREFEYSIVEAPSAGESNQAMAMAQFADGVILVLSADRTRRIRAGKIVEMFEAAQARILGTVLSDRVFPIPEGIYRRL